MKTKDIEARAAQDITIGELPKQDNPNNSDLLVIQGSSLTEATSIQQLRDKILGGGDSVNGGLGTYLFSPVPVADTSYLLMDGTKYFKNAYQDFYSFLQNQSQNAKTLFKLDEVEESFTLPDYTNLGMKVTQTTPTATTPTAGVAEHKHRINGFGKRTGFWVNQQTGTQPSSARSVLVQEVSGDQNVDRPYTGSPLDTVYNTELSVTRYPSFPSLCYIKVLNQNSNIVATPFIKSDGSVAMDLDYTPSDIQDVATKRYIDNKFLNYEVPLSFSINDIGKRIPYYSNAESNPTLIALDGTKYLITDYPDFDYTQTGFTNDGVYFWYSFLSLDIQLHIEGSFNYDTEHNGYVRIAVGDSPIIFNSKLVYNFLQTPQGAKLLVADGVGKDKDNFGFTILDASTYQIRMNVTIGLYASRGRVIYGGYGQFTNDQLGFIPYSGDTSDLPITEGRYLLKIKSDYMVAKIQQVGGGASGSGDLKSDRSVLLTGTGTFNTKEITSMDDLKDSNIIVTNSARVVTTLDSKLIDIDSKITTLESTVNNFKVAQSRRLVKPNTNIITIAGQSRLFPLDTFIPTTVAGYETDTFTIETFNGKKVIKEKMNNGIITRHLNIRLSLGHTTTMASKKVELAVFLFKGSQTGLDDNTAIATGSSMLFYDTDARGQSSNLLSVVVNGVNDSFVTEGFFIVLKSLNPSGDSLVFSKGDILINIVNSD